MKKIIRPSSNESSGSGISIGFTNSMPSSLSWKKHILDRPGVLLPVRNSGKIFYREHALDIRPGDLILYKGLPIHEFSGEADWSYYWFHTPESFFRDLLKIPCNTPVPGVWKSHFEKIELGRIRIELQEAYSLQLLRPGGWETLSAQLLQVILTRAANCIRGGNPSSEETPLQAVIRMIGEHGLTRNMGETARLCGMSRSAFFKKFHDEFGCSPIEYRDNRIIAKAKQFLHSTHMQIQEIALQLNFHDSFYFSKFFRSKTGMTPSEYRLRRNADS